MKPTLSIKATVASVSLALSGGAMAGGPITLGDNNDADINVYAKELFNGTPKVLTVDDTVQTPLAFGVSAGQERYVRFDLSANANFNVGVTAGKLVDTDTQNAGSSGFGDNSTDTDGVTIVNGGLTGDRCVVYQVTGLTDEGNLQTDVLDWTYPDLKVTDNNSVEVTYSIHDNASGASCSQNPAIGGDSNSRLAPPVTGLITKLANSIVFTCDNGTTAVADVVELYTKEVDNGTDRTKLQLGNCTTDIYNSNLNLSAEPVQRAQLFTAASIKVEGDFSAVGSVRLVEDGDCDNSNTVATATVAADRQSATFASSPNILSGWADGASAEITHLCYDVDGTTPIQKSTYKATVTFTPQTNPLAVLDTFDPQPAGIVDRNGTILRAPFTNAKDGQFNFVQVVNTGSAPAPFTVKCFTYSGSINGTTSGLSVPTGATRAYSVAQLGCPSNTTAAELTFAVPEGRVNGAMVRQNQTTGDAGIDGLVGNSTDDSSRAE